MRKGEEEDDIYGIEDEEEIYHDYSRSQIKEQIDQLPHQSFDVSSFNESKAPTDLGSKYARHNFPVSHAPTLEISPDRSIGRLNKLEQFLSDKDGTDQTARHQNQKSRNKIKTLQQQVSQLQYRLQQKTQECEEANNHTNQLNIKTLKLQSQIRQLQKSLNNRNQQIIKQNLQIKHMKNTISSTQSRRNMTLTSNQKTIDNEKSYMQEFCPEFLSPDQTVQMLTQLLMKIDTSAKMKKRILRDHRVSEMLAKIFKTG